MQVSMKQIVTGFTDWQRVEANAIRQLIRASNAESIANRHAQDEAAALQQFTQSTVTERVLFLASQGA
jgi:hypothetical protein